MAISINFSLENLVNKMWDYLPLTLLFSEEVCMPNYAFQNKQYFQNELKCKKKKKDFNYYMKQKYFSLKCNYKKSTAKFKRGTLKKDFKTALF